MRLYEFAHHVEFKIKEFPMGGFRIYVLSDDIKIDKEALPELYQKIFKYPNQIGVMDLGELTYGQLKSYPNVENVFLAKEVRRQGLGKMLYTKALNYAKEKLGAKGIGSNPEQRNINSDAFWKKYKQDRIGNYDIRYDAFEGLNEDMPRDKMEVAVDILTKAFIRRGSSIHAYVKDEGKTSMTELCEALGDKFFNKLVSFKDIDLFNKYGVLYNNFNPNGGTAFKLESEMSDLNMMMKNPEYYAKEKAWNFEVVKMSPYSYQLACKSGFGSDHDFQPEEDLVWEYALKTLEGSKMPAPSIIWTLRDGEKTFNQEGRHRSFTAELLGINYMPVIISTRCYPNPHFHPEVAEKCENFKERVFNRYRGLA